MKKTTLLIPLCTLLSAPIFAQKNTVASGSVAIGAGGTVSYSIGQTDFIAATGGGGRITQGVQQPYEIFVVTGIEKKDISLSASVYPNPTNDFVKLVLDNGKEKNLTYQLCDLQGKILSNKIVVDNETNISLTELPTSTYFIKILKSGTEIKTFKIIKN